MADRKLSSFDEMGYDNSTKVLVPVVKYSSNDPNAQIENRNIPLELFYNEPLLTSRWIDHLITDKSWIRADTFTWYSGDSQEAISYEKVYQHLVDDVIGKTPISETVAGITIWYHLADDGHKICAEDQENNVLAIYNATGVAWYYILDQANQRFKLPRTKYGFIGLRDTVGKYVPESLPNITGSWHCEIFAYESSGAFNRNYGGTGKKAIQNTTTTNSDGFNFNASRSSSTYQDNAPVQQRATQMYLYFYVGNFTQTAIENIAGQNMSIVNNKADTDLNNVNNNIDFVVDSQEPTAENNYTWYRLYKSGWVEQGGQTNNTTDGAVAITLPIKVIDAKYVPMITGIRISNTSTATNSGASKASGSFNGRSTTGFNLWKQSETPYGWEVKYKADLT